MVNRDINHFTSRIETNKVFHITFALPPGDPQSTLLLVLKTDNYARMTDFFGENGTKAVLVQLEFADGRSTKIVSSLSHLGHNTTITDASNRTVIVSGIVTHGPPMSRLYLGLLPAFYDYVRCKQCRSQTTQCGFCDDMFRSTTHHYSTQCIVHVRVTTVMQDCLYWDPKREVWTNAACKACIALCLSVFLTVCLSVCISSLHLCLSLSIISVKSFYYET